MDDQVPNDGTNKELPNDGQSRTKRRPITYQTMGQTAPNDGRSSTKRFTKLLLYYRIGWNFWFGNSFTSHWYSFNESCAADYSDHESGCSLGNGLTSKMVFQALRRFIARRGPPRLIYSDNGSQLISIKLGYYWHGNSFHQSKTGKPGNTFLIISKPDYINGMAV
ncbi:hypothetical protein BLOT_011669 [Blomia tropicalis]|nr:hypothetical protein BLOT_011669 [Blomia tropicalis]